MNKPFDDLEDATWDRLMELGTVRELTYGKSVMDPEKPALALVIAGEVSLRFGEHDLGSLPTGTLLGWESLIDSGAPLFDVQSVGPSTVLYFDREAYETLREEQNPATVEIERAALATVIGLVREIDARIAFLAKGIVPEYETPAPNVLLRQIGRLLDLVRGNGSSEVDELQVLTSSPLFSGERFRALADLAQELHTERCAEGHVVFVQGEESTRAWILLEGRIDVLVHLHGERYELLGTLGPGTLFGTTSLFEERPHMATCVCRTPATVASMPAKRWYELLHSKDPEGGALRRGTIRALTSVLRRALADMEAHERAYREEVAERLEELADRRVNRSSNPDTAKLFFR